MNLIPTAEKQKVLIVHNFYQIPGGEDTVVANEKKLLEDNGHEVFLYTRHNSEINKMNIFRKLLLPFVSIYIHKVFLFLFELVFHLSFVFLLYLITLPILQHQ